MGRVRVVLKKKLSVGDWRYENLSENYLQSQWMFYVSDGVISLLCWTEMIGRTSYSEVCDSGLSWNAQCYRS